MSPTDPPRFKFDSTAELVPIQGYRLPKAGAEVLLREYGNKGILRHYGGLHHVAHEERCKMRRHEHTS